MDKKYTTIISVPSLDKVSKNRAIKLFNTYKSESIIDGYFDHNYWTISNEVIIHGVHFDIVNYQYEEYISKEDFIDYLKIYFLFRIGELQSITLVQIVNQAKKIVQTKNINSLNENMYSIQRIIELFNLLPVEMPFIDDLEAILLREEAKTGAQRNLKSIQSYFRFDEVLTNFYKDETDNIKKLFYFPIWFWWNFTGIIPTRPTEFIITQRNCFKSENGINTITLRKTRLKGNNKKISYKISKDYSENTYIIPDKLANMIRWYLEETKGYRDNEINALFCPDIFFEYIGVPRSYRSRYLSYSNVCSILKLFYEEVIKDYYGYEILYDDNKKYLGTNEIQVIHLGDTRHISLINFMKEGGNPVNAMLMAGHDNIAMFEHYASNVDSYIECMAEREYKYITSHHKKQFTISRYKGPLTTVDYITVENGKCFSKKYREGNFEDCVNVYSKDNSIGNCADCTYFRSNNMSYENSKDLYISKIKEDLELIKTLYKQLKPDKDDPDELLQAALQYKADELTYKKYLLETKEFEHHG